ncbi:MAG: methyl-accepting chemotaxis protein [Defluviitaleaceae bacterium]|nr:methyl-accepting chemotaxis protein [Defluviitaleaceae bacterium]
MRIKLRTKIVGGFLCVFMIAVVLGGYSFLTLHRINELNQELALITELNDTVHGFVTAHHVWGFNLQRAFLFDEPFTGGLDPYGCGYGVWKQGDGPTRINDAQILTLVDAIYLPHYTLHIQGAEAVRLREEGRTEEAMDLVRTVVLPAVVDSTFRITALSNRYQELRDEAIEAKDSLASTAHAFIIMALAASLIAFILLSYLITKSIMSPIKGLVSLVSDVTDGRLSINKNTASLADDEIGKLTTDIYSLVDVIKAIVDDLSKAYNEYMHTGDVNYTINDSRYRNSFKEVVEHINTLLAQNTTNITSISSMLNQVSEGEFDLSLKAEDWPGDWAATPTAFARLIQKLKDVSEEINSMIDAAAKKGNLAIHIDETKQTGGWREIMLGLNSLADAVNNPIQEIRDVMEHMGEGRFDKKVTGDYPGDFAVIKNGVNSTIGSLNSYISEMNDTLASISSGDLTKSINREYIGDFAPIKASINNISQTLNKTMSEISTASSQVLSGAKQISTSAMDLANGAQTQASSIQELNASVDLINQQTQANAKNASEANELSNKSTANAREGNDAMQQTLGAMTQIKDASNNISKIIRTIQDIAFQTNLLALNAAVEAARAGEHGKGFAVVAEEVRSLAARSQKAASETTELIGTSINTVDTGSEIAQSTAATLDTIVDNATKVLDIVSEISSASTNQAEAVSQVVSGLSQISQVVQSNSAVSEETAAASEELNSQAELLQQLVSYFRV